MAETDHQEETMENGSKQERLEELYRLIAGIQDPETDPQIQAAVDALLVR